MQQVPHLLFLAFWTNLGSMLYVFIDTSTSVDITEYLLTSLES